MMNVCDSSSFKTQVSVHAILDLKTHSLAVRTLKWAGWRMEAGKTKRK